jgi:hypothetical protein
MFLNNSMLTIVQKTMVANHKKITLQDYYAFVMSHLLDAYDLLNNKQYESEENHNILNEQIQTYHLMVDSIIELFRNIDNKSNFASAIIQLFKDCSTKAEARSKLQTIYVNRLDVFLADIFFLDCLIQSLIKNNKGLIICGGSHAMNLAHIFESWGYKSIINLTSRLGSESSSFDHIISKDFINKIIPIVDLFLKADNADGSDVAQILRAEIDEKLAKNVNAVYSLKEEILCNACKKDLSEQSPLRCSRCKNVYYCNAACQTADWKTHKKSCKAAK